MEKSRLGERRLFYRFNANYSSVKVLDFKFSRQSEGRIKDFSAKGLRFLSNTRLDKYTPVKLWITVSELEPPFSTEGRVVWEREVEKGLWEVGIDLERAEFRGMSRLLRKEEANY